MWLMHSCPGVGDGKHASECMCGIVVRRVIVMSVYVVHRMDVGEEGRTQTSKVKAASLGISEHCFTSG